MGLHISVCLDLMEAYPLSKEGFPVGGEGDGRGKAAEMTPNLTPDYRGEYIAGLVV